MKAMKLLLVVVCFIVTGAVQAQVIDQIKEPYFEIYWVQCANDGVGESVYLEGMQNITIRAIDDAAGGFHFGISNQLMGVSGYGGVTGDKYRAVGTSTDQLHDTDDYCPQNYSFVHSFRVIGPGKDNDALVRQTIHVVVDANCNTTVDRSEYTVDCQ